MKSKEARSSVLQERRHSKLVRAKQRYVHEQIEKRFDEICQPNAEGFAELRNQNNALFLQAKNAREQLNDVINVKELARAAHNQATAMDDMSRRFVFVACHLPNKPDE